MSSLPDLFNLLQHIDTQLSAAEGPDSLDRRPTASSEKLTKYILVGVGSLHLAIAIEDMAEVGPLPTITFLPNLPAWIQGIVNIRSEIISVIDLPGFLGGKAQDGGSGSRFIVLRHRKLKVGFRLDRIIGTVGRFSSDTEPLDRLDTNRKDTKFFHFGLQVDKQFYYVLDVGKLLTSPRLVDYHKAG